MRLSRIWLVGVLCCGMGLARAQTDPVPPEAIDLDQVRAVVAAATGHVAALDALIAAQEEKLDALYGQRDVAAAGDDDGRADQRDALIDRLNLTLTQLEAERVGIAGTIATLTDQIAVLTGSQTGTPGDAQQPTVTTEDSR